MPTTKLLQLTVKREVFAEVLVEVPEDYDPMKLMQGDDIIRKAVNKAIKKQVRRYDWEDDGDTTEVTEAKRLTGDDEEAEREDGTAFDLTELLKEE